MIDKTLIGTKMPSHSTVVDANRLRLFARATGQTDPVYLEDSAAQAAGHRGLPMPPTMAFCFDMDVPEPFEILDLLGVELGRLLHGEQRFEYFGDVCAGDTLTYRTTISDIYDKKDGALEFIVTDTDVDNQDGECVVKMNRVYIIRN